MAKDAIEREYEWKMRAVDTDEEAFELSIGLKQYRELFKVEDDSAS